MPIWQTLLISAAVFGLLGFGLLVSGLGRLRRAPFGALVRLMLGTAAILLATALGTLGGGLRGFERLDSERDVARLSFTAAGPQAWSVRFEDAATGRVEQLDLRGDEWQLDARVVRWQLPAALAGVPSLYRLERLSGRYGDPKQETTSPRTVHALGQRNFPELATLKQSFARHLPIFDVEYGSATYLPMIDGASFVVTLHQRGGLIARPADAASERRLEESGW